VSTLSPYVRPSAWSLVMGSLLLLAGLVAIAVPFFGGIAASLFFAWVLLFAGAAHLGYAWMRRGAGAVLWQILVGIAYLIAALYLFMLPVAGMVALTLVLVFYIGVEGILELVIFSTLRRLPGSVWFLVDGVVSLVLAGLIFAHWPSSSLWAIGTLVGISLVLSGVARMSGGLARPIPAGAV
jgi:uncharacterized membrane protein HdeD (DUF308 family)